MDRSYFTKKAEVIITFLNECGENASREDWSDFLQERQAKGFDWNHSVELIRCCL
jgi:hypothetical protein